jgi:glycosyltransferase involved in cell wall biosynthesis
MALRAARRRSVPLVLTHHTRFGEYRHYLGPFAPAAGLVLESYLKRFRETSAAVIAPSEALASGIRATHGARGRPMVRAIPTGVDVAAIGSLAPLDPRPPSGWPPEAVVAVTLGRLAPEKNVHLLLDAFSVAAARVPELRLLVIGSGPAEAILRRRAEAADLRGLVAFTGLLSRSAALARLRCSDLFVLASLTETQGLVLAEATACGLPTVALDGPAVAETVRHGKEGVLVAATGGDRDRRALGEAIAELAADRERRAAMAATALADAARLDVSVSLGRTLDLYDAVSR